MVRNYIRRTEDRWSKEQLLAAVIQLKDHKIKIKDVTVKYGISRATLYRNLQKFIEGGSSMDLEQFKTCGGNPILTKVEEAVLEKTIKDLRDQGYDITAVDVKRICFEYCLANGIPNRFSQEKGMASDDWYYGFLKRHPELAVTKKAGAGGRPRGKIGQATSKTESEREVIRKAAKKSNGKCSNSSERNARRRVWPRRSDVKGKEVCGSPKLVAPDGGTEVDSKKVNAAKRFKRDPDAAGTGSRVALRSMRTRSTSVGDLDNDNEEGKLVDDAVTGVEEEVEKDLIEEYTKEAK